MNQLNIGTKRQVKPPTKGGYLLINDELPKVRGAKIFDPTKHGLNPLKDLDYRKTCDFIDIIDALFSDSGEGTLTKDTGLDFIAERLGECQVAQVKGEPFALADLIPEPDKKAPTGHIWAYGKMQRILRSPVLTSVLCDRKDFAFNPRSVVLARVNRVELGEFDALAIGLFLMARFEGQLVVNDLGFYGRDTHTALIRENRLIAGINHLDELPERLRSAVLLIEDKVASGALYDDAVLLAKHAGLYPDPTREDNDFNKYVREAMA